MATLVMGGFDPSGGAGVTADLEVLRDLNEPPLAVVTAITAQNATQFVDSQPVTATLLQAQIEAIFDLHDVRACKVGMLGSLASAKVVLSTMKHTPEISWIVDPIISSTSGGLLMPLDVQELLIEELIPRCSVLTPNLSEAKILFKTELKDAQDLEGFGAHFSAHSKAALLLKGGHLDGLPTDVLAHNSTITRFESRERYSNARGTGCRLATALAVHLSRGTDLIESVRRARAYVADYLIAQEKTT